MTQVVDCPRCNRKLNLAPELIGRLVQCPACQNTFNAQPAAPPAAPAYDPPPPASGGPPSPAALPDPFMAPDAFGDNYEADAGDANSWRRVRTGLTIFIVGVLLMVGLFVVMLIAGMVMAMSLTAQGGPPPPRRAGGIPGLGDLGGLFGGAIILMVLVLLGFLAFVVLWITGASFCLAAPPRQNAKTLALAHLILFCAYLAISLFGALVNAGRAGRDPVGVEMALSFLNMLLFLGAFFVHLFFLRATALCMNRPGLAQNVTFLTILGAVNTAIMVIFVLVGLAGGPARGGRGPDAGIVILSCSFLLFGLVFVVWHIVSLFMIRGAISASVDRF